MEARIEPLHSDTGENLLRRDEQLFLEMEAALRDPDRSVPVLPILRIYQWSEPTVSLGRGQKPEVALAPRWEDWSRDPKSDPLGPAAVVQRPTGGRAVWHEDELTYSVVLPLDLPRLAQGRSPDEVVGRWLLDAGTAVGIEGLSLERGGGSRDPLGLGAAPCFASTSRNELKWLGSKWVGSARRIGKHCLLQHGAIRLGPAGDRLEIWLGGTPPPDPRHWSSLPSAERLARSLIDLFPAHIL
jgi:lipoate-protein ligase A